MGIDRPDDDDIPAAGDHEPDVSDERGRAEPGDPADDGDRDQYRAEYRAKVEAVYAAVYLADARGRWETAKPGLEQEWRQYAHDHPTAPRVLPDIDPEACAQVERGCKEIRETEEKVVTPAMERIEAEDPERKLVGLGNRCKGGAAI